MGVLAAAVVHARGVTWCGCDRDVTCGCDRDVTYARTRTSVAELRQVDAVQECLLVVLAARRVGRRQAADVRGYDDDRLDVADVYVVVILVALRRRHNLLLLARVNCEQQTTAQNDDVTAR